jgi:serine/threonine protein kinase
MHHKDDPNQKYAVKVYAKNCDQEASVRHFRQELNLKHLDHPSIIKLIDLNENGKLYFGRKEMADVRYAVLELASNGDLLDYIANNSMDESVVRYYFKQL